MDGVGKWVRVNRLANGWTQTELGSRIGSDSGSVSRWERDAGLPSLVQFRRLCLEFECSADKPLGLPLAQRKRVRRAAASPD